MYLCNMYNIIYNIYNVVQIFSSSITVVLYFFFYIRFCKVDRNLFVRCLFKRFILGSSVHYNIVALFYSNFGPQ